MNLGKRCYCDIFFYFIKKNKEIKKNENNKFLLLVIIPYQKCILGTYDLHAVLKDDL